MELNMFEHDQHVATDAARAGVSRRRFIGSASRFAAALLAVNPIDGMRLFEVSEAEAHGQEASRDFVDAQQSDMAQWIAAPIRYTTGVPFQLGYGPSTFRAAGAARSSPTRYSWSRATGTRGRSRNPTAMRCSSTTSSPTPRRRCSGGAPWLTEISHEHRPAE